MYNELKYTLRIDEELMERLRIMAEEHTRSVNNKIKDIIKKALKEFKSNEKTDD